MTQNMKTHPVTDKNPGGTEYHAPIWDRGGTVDAQLMAFTIGDDWRMDRQLVEHDIRGSQAHAAGLLAAGLISGEDQRAISVGLAGLLDDWYAGQWDLGPGDEDVHSAVERHLVERIGEAGKRLHTGRSRNEQVALDMLLWLRSAARSIIELLVSVAAERGLTLVVSLHDLSLARDLFPRIVGLRSGQVVFDRPTDDLDETAFANLYQLVGERRRAADSG